MKKIITTLIITLLLILSSPIMVSALTIDGTVYDRDMWCAIVTSGFGQHNGVNLVNDNGHTANLLGTSATPIASYGYWYNSALGIERSKQVGAVGYVNGGYETYVPKSTWQWNNLNTGVGYQGSISSPYRGISRSIDQHLWSPGWGPGHSTLLWSFSLSKNNVYGKISGLDSSDESLARIAVTGTGLPNSNSYGSSETFSSSGITSVNESVRYGNYYVSAYIPNASKYNITYKVTYMRGNKYSDRNNNYNYYNYNGSASFSSPSYYMESGGYLDVSIIAKKKGGTVIVDLYKGAGVTESYENKAFNLYNSSGSYLSSSTTDSSGYAYFYDIPYGTYSVESSSPPANHYYDPPSQSVVLTGYSATAKFTLYRNSGNLQINYSTEDNLSKGNVRFKITDPNGVIGYYYTNSSGQISLLNSIIGAYLVEQMEAPIDYEKAEAMTVTVNKSSTTTVYVYNPILYDFSIDVSGPIDATQMDSLTITAVFKNKGGKNCNDVMAMVIYDGSIVYNNIVAIPAGENLTKQIAVYSSTVGSKLVSASINAGKMKRESNMIDNDDYTFVNIIPATNLQIEFILPNQNYREGTDVISSFRVKNVGFNHITPVSNLSVRLAVTYIQNGITKSVIVPDAKQVIIPSGGDNIVFFKWNVPSGTAGLQFKLIGIVDAEGKISELSEADNSVIAYRTIEKSNSSTTPDTLYESKKPNEFNLINAPSRTVCSSLSWAIWEWENGWFKKNTYGMQINSSSAPSITPDINSPSRKYEDGVWSMGSGYGFSVNWNVVVQTASGVLTPNTTSYTSPQTANLYLPEFMYSNVMGKYMTLERSGLGSFCLPLNPFTKNSSRVHFTPLWFPNGNYVCQGNVSDIWTPAGMLYGYYNSNTITIAGSAYDDWYLVGGRVG